LKAGFVRASFLMTTYEGEEVLRQQDYYIGSPIDPTSHTPLPPLCIGTCALLEKGAFGGGGMLPMSSRSTAASDGHDELSAKMLSLRQLHMDVFDTPGDTPLEPGTPIPSVYEEEGRGRKWGGLHDCIALGLNLSVADRGPTPVRDSETFYTKRVDCATEPETEHPAEERTRSACLSPRVHAILTMNGSAEDGVGVLTRLTGEIRRRAHEIWLKTGNTCPEENWLAAERSILRRDLNPETQRIRELQCALQAQATRIRDLERILEENKFIASI
jgi:hypothetical protein